ncbi:MAG: tautomerase family protein [Janthinobacterium lividum]
MPLWKIYHPKSAYTAEEKQAIAAKITGLYAAAMPKFYVGVIFQEIAPDSFYIGGEPHGQFVRIWIDHIAREFKSENAVNRFIKGVNDVLAPWVRDRGFDWEFHIDETPFAMWSIQGYSPPAQGTADELRWIAENRPSPRTDAE